MKFDWKKDGIRFLVIIAAAMIAAFNIKVFVRTGGLYPGGVTGITVLIQRSAERFLGLSIPYTPVNLLLNAVPIYIGFKYVGKKLTGYSCLMIFLTGIFTDMLPTIAVTYDTLLISIFGGIIGGSAASLCLHMNATTGGTDFIAIYLSEKKGVESWNLMLGLNVIILSAAGLLFGWDKALYSIIYQFVSTQVLHSLYKKYQRQTLFIVTNHPKEVCEAIYRTSFHGATILTGEGSYGHQERNVVYSVISGAESRKVIRAVREVDKEAFINAVRTAELSGRFYQAREE